MKGKSSMLRRNGIRSGLIFILVSLNSEILFSDQFHYNNIIVGDRAMGLSGAYCGVSDDASGVVYNPAGLAFALSNDISGSANAFYSREVKYKKTIGESDFKEQSSGSVPSFFGGLQKLDNIMDGLVFAFGIYSTDNEQKDQNDKIVGVDLTSTSIDRFHRTSNMRAATTYFGGSLAKRLTNKISMGVGMNYISINELIQEYQDAKQYFKTAGFYRILTQNIRQNLVVTGIQPVLGMQMALGRFSLGVTLKKGVVLSEKMELGTETRTAILSADANTALEDDSTTTSATGTITRVLNDEEVKKPITSFPLELRTGIAWFASTKLLVTGDVSYHSAVTDAGKIESFGKAMFNKEAVMNFYLGTEYYVLNSLPVRLGYFTNNDARPNVEEGKSAQADHVDYNGYSGFLAWVQPNSQVAVGGILQFGSGKAQKLGDTAIQDVDGNSRTFAFSASHNF